MVLQNDALLTVTLRYYKDVEFKTKIDRVIQALEYDKRAALNADERPLVIFATGLLLLFQEETDA